MELSLYLLFFVTWIANAQDFELTEEQFAEFKVSGNFNATIRVDRSNTQSLSYFIYASGLPDHKWEKVNPNDPENKHYNISIPKKPTVSNVPGCLPMGMIGISRTGVALYNPLDGALENAVEGNGSEVLDSCDGHPSPDGAYHYHKLPHSCMYKHEVDEFMGVALDGYPIYGPIISAGLIMDGNLSSGGNVTSKHLDKCHGRLVNGKYRYYMTYEFPYIMGCFKGVVIHRTDVTYNCDSDTSQWNDEWKYYLCHCTGGGGGGGGQGGGNMRPECAPNYPNRPDDCPTPPDCSPTNPNRPAECEMLCSPNSNRRRPPSCDLTTMRPTSSTTMRPTDSSTEGVVKGPTGSVGRPAPLFVQIILSVTCIFTSIALFIF